MSFFPASATSTAIALFAVRRALHVPETAPPLLKPAGPPVPPAAVRQRATEAQERARCRSRYRSAPYSTAKR